LHPAVPLWLPEIIRPLKLTLSFNGCTPAWPNRLNLSAGSFGVAANPSMAGNLSAGEFPLFWTGAGPFPLHRFVNIGIAAAIDSVLSDIIPWCFSRDKAFFCQFSRGRRLKKEFFPDYCPVQGKEYGLIGCAFRVLPNCWIDLPAKLLGLCCGNPGKRPPAG
jgi:hypothetical protein